MSDSLGKCPSCDAPGEVGRSCQDKVCQKRGYHFIPEDHWTRAHAGKDPNPDPVIGLEIGDFLVVDILGAGGFGKVFLALQSPLFRLQGALKLIEFPNDDENFQQALLEKFQGEAEVLADLSHPNVVRLIKYGIHRERPYLVMEYLENGLTLRDEIFKRARAKKGFDQEELRHIFHQLLNGLEAAHARKIIHRDLKPENIMLQRVVGNPYHVRILDFGIAKFVEGQGTTKWPLGSPSYMAPEQVGLQNLGTWTDLYALGVMFFEMVTGRRPFPGDTDEAIMVKKLKEAFDPFEQVEDLEIPEPTIAFLRRAIAKEPEDRHQTVAEFRDDIDVALESLEGHQGGVGPGGRELTFLLQSKDIVEMDETSAPTKVGQSQPPDLPSGSSLKSDQTSDEPANESSRVKKASKGLSKVAAVGLVAALLAVGAFYATGNLDGIFDRADTDSLPAEDEAVVAVVDAGADLIAADAAQAASDGGDFTSEVDVDAASGDVGDTDVTDGGDSGDTTADARPPLPAQAIVGLSAGKYHTCALRADGKFRCWGANFDGELGLGHTRKLGDNEAINLVEPVDLGAAVHQIVAVGDRQASFTCALVDDGTRLEDDDVLEDGSKIGHKVRCWGANEHGQLGYGHTRRLGDDESLAGLPDIAVGADATQIAAGASQFGSHVCALLDDESLRCWGSAKFGKLGYGHTNIIGDDELPSSVGKVAVGAKIGAIAAGKYNTCAILEDRSLRCWGWNGAGQLGLGHTRDIGDDEIPASVDPIDVGGPVEHVSVGRRHVCALLESKKVRCWGWNNRGQLGLGHTEPIGDDETPASVDPVELTGPAKMVVAGSLHSCAILEDGRVQCWGDNKFGQLGYGHTNAVGDKASPKTMGTVYLGRPATSITVGSYHTCAVLGGGDEATGADERGQVRCWGYNDHGQLGYGHTNHIGDDEPPGSVANVAVQ
jgi:serine/threonine protein kinase/alpha-tubulin suppressor-like RCC1 family protein